MSSADLWAALLFFAFYETARPQDRKKKCGVLEGAQLTENA